MYPVRTGYYGVGAYVRPSIDNGKAYRVVNAGTAAVEPDWKAARVRSGSVEIQAIGSSAEMRSYGLLGTGVEEARR